MNRIVFILVGVLSLTACQQHLLFSQANNNVNSTVAVVESSHCASNGVTVNFGFENARVNGCDISGNTVTLHIAPENKPINDSAWYAFNVSTVTSQQTNFVVNYEGGTHRYNPKQSIDLTHWQNIPFEATNSQLKFSVMTSEFPTYIAAQEIIASSNYQQWFANYQASDGVVINTLGKSTQGRDITAMEISQPNNKEWIVVLGRMHPPEVTGAIALFPFVDEMLGAQGKAFRQRFNVLVVPNLNPDGVAHGHWRHNAAGMDLNRDWKSFKQIESQLIRNKLNEITSRGDTIVFAVDFHSTHKDVFYTLPTDYGIKPAKLVESWLEALATQVPEFVVNNQPGTSNVGVFKQFIADIYNVHAITYEMGDETDRAVIKEVAEAASKTLMDKLLAI